MKHFTSMLLLVVLCLHFSCALAEEAVSPQVNDFKQFNWGDTKDAVTAVEGTPLAEGKVNGSNATYYAYQTQAVGLDVLLAYYFCDEGLYAVRYVLTETHTNDSRFIDDYQTFRAALTKKYGEPFLDNESWSSDSKKQYYADDKGTALNFGYLSYLTWYITDRSLIEMKMSADNFEISMTVDYSSMEISPGEVDFSDDV